MRSRPSRAVGSSCTARSRTASLDMIDPFLLLDEMGPTDVAPGEALGAPDHPHRGPETVTYMLDGEVEHRDSAGNHGIIGTGDVQWMTAGAGVVHSEMPGARLQRDGGRSHGLQLWVNLPRAAKMTPPRYQDLRATDILTAPSAGRVGQGDGACAGCRRSGYTTKDPHLTGLKGGATLDLAEKPSDEHAPALCARARGVPGPPDGRAAGPRSSCGSGPVPPAHRGKPPTASASVAARGWPRGRGAGRASASGARGALRPVRDANTKGRHHLRRSTTTSRPNGPNNGFVGPRGRKSEVLPIFPMVPMARRSATNVAIIAHVDHGKTTLVDAMLWQTCIFRQSRGCRTGHGLHGPGASRKGITILAKNTSVSTAM